MSTAELRETAKIISTPGKGILAADESLKTITKRFEAFDVECTEPQRRNYREMLFTTPDLSNYVSGVILFEETLIQASTKGPSLGHVLIKQGILPGIKVDKGLIDLEGTNGEKVTQGLDGLGDRLAEYKQQGAKFAKWRAVFNISDTLPSQAAIIANAEGLAEYAAICQSKGIVPIVEPELLMDGDHSFERCKEATRTVLKEVFKQLDAHKVLLEGIVLKPSMVVAGSNNPNQANVEDVADATVEVLSEAVPATVPTINFLSGGQSAELATQHLNAMNQRHPNLPWQLSFSYGRALQAPSIAAWKGEAANVDAAQMLLNKRVKLNSAATLGQYSESME